MRVFISSAHTQCALIPRPSNISIPIKTIERMLPNSFICFGHKTDAQLRMDPLFLKYDLKPSIATKKDLSQIAKLEYEALKEEPVSMAQVRQNCIIDLCDELGLPFDTPEEVIRNILIQCVGHVPEDAEKVFNNDKEFLTIETTEAKPLNIKSTVTKLQKRFIDNKDTNRHPRAALVVLKYGGKIIAMEGINQFQETHDAQIERGDFTPLDPDHPVHALLSGLYVIPEYRGKRIGTALKKTVIQYARDALNYQYVWAPTEVTNSSHRINQKLGYKPLTPETKFPDSAVFTPAKIEWLLKEYNLDSRQLCWLDTRSKEAQQMLSVEPDTWLG